MRLVVFVSTILGLAVAGYLAISGYFLAKAASGVLTVGTLASAFVQQDRTDDPLALGYRGTPTQALGLAFEAVTLDTPLGPAEAWLVPASGVETGRAIYIHGIAGAREDGFRHLPALHAAGWSVLMISVRNDPSAPLAPEGRYGFGLSEWPDLEAAVARLAPQPDDARLLVLADSMGAAILGQFLRNSALADRVGAVALDSPALSFRAVVTHLAGQSGRPLPAAVAGIARLMAPQLTGLPLQDAEVQDQFAAFAGPLFVAHGAADRIVPIAPSQALADMRAGPTTVLWSGSDHLGSFAEDPAAYKAAFADFLAALGGLGG